MFKSARWRNEKNKIEVTFKLQFYASQVLQPGVDALALSLIPVDVGKPSVRLESANVLDGNCRWENPVYETVKFIQDTRTGKITEKIYHFVVSTGTKKTGFFGEVFMNFAYYADATKPSSVSLPLKSSQSSTVLHVSIQRLQENADQREVEDCEGDKEIFHDRSLKMYLSSSNTDDSNQTNSTENASSKALRHKVGLSVDSRSSSGSEMTLSGSESSYGVDTSHEINLRNSSISQGPDRFLSSLSHYSEAHKTVSNASKPLHKDRQRSRSDSSAGSDHGLCLDDSTNSSHDGLMRERSVQASDADIEKLKAEMAILVRQMNISELELQTLRKQIVKENKRGQDLLKEVATLKEQRDTHKSECERLRSFQKRMDEAKVRNKLQFENGDLRTLLEETKEELSYERELNANLRVQLQKTQESNDELVLAVRDLDEMLEGKNKEISNLSNRLESEDSDPDLRKSETDDDEEQKALEKLVKQYSNVKEAYVLEQKMVDLYSEIEIYRREKDELELQMEQLALDYEILKQENHDISYKLEQSELQEQLKMQYEYSSPSTAANDLENHIQNLENELKRKSKEFSDSLVTIEELETHIKTLEDELEKQARGFEADLECLTNFKVEQEQRAITAEEALRQTKLKNASTAERLQEDLRRLSMQMASTFDANEKLAMTAMTEANELRAEKNKLEEMLLGAKKELHSINSNCEGKVHEFSCQIDMKTQQIENMLLEVEYKAKELESQQKHEKEVIKNFSEEIQMLKAENQRLEVEIVCLSEKVEQKEDLKAEMESMKPSVEEAEALVQRANAQRNEYVSAIALFKKETEKYAEELNKIKHIKDEKERMSNFLSSELENLKAQCSDFKNSLFEDEVEKEKLRKQVVQLKGDLKKKDNAIASIDKKFKDKNGRIAISNGTKIAPNNNKSPPNSQTPKEVSSSLREKIKMLEDLIKMKENALETSTTSFLEKEKELEHKIEDLEVTMEKLNQSSPPQKVVEDKGTLTSNDDIAEMNEDTMSLDMRIDGILREPKGSTAKANHGIHNHGGDIATELASLKERNRSMESELMEMQERYSEISLKFAEVEGERQKLVMTVRNLKNAKKS